MLKYQVEHSAYSRTISVTLPKMFSSSRSERQQKHEHSVLKVYHNVGAIWCCDVLTHIKVYYGPVRIWN